MRSFGELRLVVAERPTAQPRVAVRRRSYSIEYLPAAAKQIRKLDQVAQDRVTRVIAMLADTPRPPNAIQFVGGAGEWRVRTGDCRIVYEIVDDVLLVLVARVMHRSQVYR